MAQAFEVFDVPTRGLLSVTLIEIGGPALVVGRILRLDAFMAGPCLDQRAIDGEMLVRQQRPDILVLQQCLHEPSEQIALLQTLAVLCKRGGVPHAIVRCKPNEPAVQQVVVQLLHQLPFTPDAIQHLE